MCSHSGLSVRLSSSISGERSVSVHVEPGLQMGRVVSAARAELEQRPGAAVRDLVDDPRDERGLVRVVGRMREQVEPRREVGVDAHPLRECTKAAEAAFVACAGEDLNLHGLNGH